MDLEYELLKEFDRVISQCDQGMPSNVNITDNASGSVEQCSMMLCLTGGLGEAGSNVASPVIMDEKQKSIQSLSFPPEELNTPQPVNWKMDKRIPHFLSKVYQIVDDPMTDHLVHWGLEGNSFIVQDAVTFCNVILPKYFKHGNFSSFIRQLNTYGFRKIDCDKWEFATPEFQRGRIDRLKYIKRRTSISKLMGVRSGKHDDKFQKHLKSLSAQISNLSHQVEVSSSIISAYEKKMQDIELKYKHMANMLSKTIQNPDFMAELFARKTSVLSKHGSDVEIETPSEQKLAEMQLSLCIGESSCSPNEPQGSMVKVVMDDDDSLRTMQNALMNEMEPYEGVTSEKCVLYLHELASLIPVDEIDGSWVSFANPHVDKKPKLT